MPPAFHILHIDHVVLRVADLQRSLEFYDQLLGCAVRRRRESLGMIHLAAGSSLIDLVAIDGPLGRKGGGAPGREGHNLDHLCLRIEPFDELALRAHLQAAGCRWSLPSNVMVPTVKGCRCTAWTLTATGSSSKGRRWLE